MLVLAVGAACGVEPTATPQGKGLCEGGGPDAAPGEAASGEAASGEAASSEAASSEAAPGEAAPAQSVGMLAREQEGAGSPGTREVVESPPGTDAGGAMAAPGQGDDGGPVQNPVPDGGTAVDARPLDPGALDCAAPGAPTERPEPGSAAPVDEASQPEPPAPVRVDAAAILTEPDAPAAPPDPAPAPPVDQPGAVPTPAPRAPRQGDLRITEVLVNPRGSDAGREWFEIVNVTDEPLALAGLRVADRGREVPVPGAEDLVLAPGAFLVLGQRLDREGNGGAPVTLAYGSAIPFNNDGDSLSVCVGPCGFDGVATDGSMAAGLIAQVSWGNLGARYDGKAAQFRMDDGSLSCPATTPYGDNGDLGSPGVENPPCAP